jgi:hypothetical protein
MNIFYAIYADKTVFVEILNNIKKMLKFYQKSSFQFSKMDKNNCPFFFFPMNFFLEILTFFRLKHNAVNGKNMIFILLHNFFFYYLFRK